MGTLQNRKNQREKEKVRLSIGGFFILSLFISFYITGMLETVGSSYGASVSPLIGMKAIVEKGFSVSTFLFFVIVLNGSLLYMKLRYKERYGKEDVLGRRFRTPKDRKTYGESHFEEPEEYEDVAIIQTPEEAYGTILGCYEKDNRKLINTRMDNESILPNQHIAIFGSSGSGKTYCFVKDFCFQVAKRRESVVFTDPKGELYRDMAQYYKDNGYIVKRLDLKRLERSDGWDIMKLITPERAEEDSILVAKIIMANVSEKDDIYMEGAMSLLRALILRVYFGDDYPVKSIKTAYNLLQNVGGMDFLDAIFDENNMNDEARCSMKPYAAFKLASERFAGNLASNLAIKLQLLQTDIVCDILSRDDIDINMLGDRPCAYFCVFPDQHSSYQFIVSLFFNMTFAKLVEKADDTETGELTVPVNFMLDEFANIGEIPDFDRKVSVVRSRKMNIVIILQNLGQLQNSYKDTWETILGNMPLWMALSVNDKTTAEFLASRIGETTVRAETVQIQKDMSPLSTFTPMSMGEGRRALLAPDEIQKLPPRSVLIIPFKHNPILATAYPHSAHPEAKKLKPIPPKTIPSIYDTAARKERDEKERAFADRYLEAHPLSEVDRTYIGKCEPSVALHGSFSERFYSSLFSYIDKAKEIIKPEKIDFTAPPVDKDEQGSDIDDILSNSEIQRRLAEIEMQADKAVADMKVKYEPKEEPREEVYTKVNLETGEILEDEEEDISLDLDIRL